MLSAPPPKYPLESRRKREQGIVALSVLLGTDGRVETLSVSSSSGFDRLDKAALKAVREWRWAPLVRNGAPVQVRGIVTIPFQLRG
ncbi:energy transducer TonB [Sphingosinicella sp. BN140058]|nr:energy transducer TonB [Sphingosinicella sp. BN140058]